MQTIFSEEEINPTQKTETFPSDSNGIENKNINILVQPMLNDNNSIEMKSKMSNIKINDNSNNINVLTINTSANNSPLSDHNNRELNFVNEHDNNNNNGNDKNEKLISQWNSVTAAPYKQKLSISEAFRPSPGAHSNNNNKNENKNENKNKVIYEKILNILNKFDLFLQGNKKYLEIFYIVMLGNACIVLFLVFVSENTSWKWLPFSILPTNNWKFQLANACLLTSYILNNILYLRLAIGLACFWFILWALTFDPLPIFDTVLWNYIMMLINIRYAISLFYAKRPIHFDEWHEQVYANCFDGILSRADFRDLLKGSLLRDLLKDRYYGQIGDTCSNLSLLVRGKIKIIRADQKERIREATLSPRLSINNNNSNNNRNHNKQNRDNNDRYHNDTFYRNQINHLQTNENPIELHIGEFEFIDSPEWIMRNTQQGSRYSVEFLAVTDCLLLTWPRELLLNTLEQNPYLKTPLLGALGIDVSRKVFATN